MNSPLMPKSTAVWLIENTKLTFEQISKFCKMHILEIQGIADGEVAVGIQGKNPLVSGELTKEEMLVVDSALKDDAPEITLSVISLLRQLGKTGRNILIKVCRDKDLLRAKASISALLEMKDQTVSDLFDELINDKSIDPLIKDDITRDKII